MKKQILFIGAMFSMLFSFSSVQSTHAACNEGHSSTGNQGFGGPNGRWELVCDQASSVVCCVSHPKPQQ
jgi:hypothetical protein